jgi:hypothetical protein
MLTNISEPNEVRNYRKNRESYKELCGKESLYGCVHTQSGGTRNVSSTL